MTVYTPNSQNELKRLDYRMRWEDDFRAYLKALDEKKPVVVTGDMNVAHAEIESEESEVKSPECGIYRRRTGEIYRTSGCGIYRYIPLFLSRSGGDLLLVVVSV